MRVAAIYDIHGNLPALEAVLVEVERAAPDVIVVGGDVASGPLPAETLELLIALADRARFIRGNADRELVAGGRDDGGLSDTWCARRLSAEQRDFLARLPQTLVLTVDGLGPTLFCHGSPRSDEEIITEASPEGRLLLMLAGVEQGVVVCGHTHVPFVRMVDGIRVVNPGSVGMPYGERGAFWGLFGPGVELRRTTYDLEAAAQRIRQSGWPRASEFAAENVLSVPSAEDAIRLFEQMAAAQLGEPF